MDKIISKKGFKKINLNSPSAGEKNKMKVNEVLIYIILPLLPLIVFWFIPMIVSFLLSFTNWDYISPSFDIVGLYNYKYIITSKGFYQALKNTLIFGLGTVFPTLCLGFFMSLLLYGKLKARETFQGFLFSPWITPMVAMSIVWSWFYRPEIGLFNQILDFFGIQGPNWLTDSSTAMIAVIIVTIWKQSGWAMLFYTDAFEKIPKDLFEVANLEGASVIDKIKYIFLPMTRTTTFFLAIINLISSIQAYDQISVLTGGGPAGSTRTLLYLFYQMAFERFDMGKATSVAIIIVIITGILSLILSKIRKGLEV